MNAHVVCGVFIMCRLFVCLFHSNSTHLSDIGDCASSNLLFSASSFHEPLLTFRNQRDLGNCVLLNPLFFAGVWNQHDNILAATSSGASRHLDAIILRDSKPDSSWDHFFGFLPFLVTSRLPLNTVPW
jgi:hypothetical protein